MKRKCPYFHTLGPADKHKAMVSITVHTHIIPQSPHIQRGLTKVRMTVCHHIFPQFSPHFWRCLAMVRLTVNHHDIIIFPQLLEMYHNGQANRQPPYHSPAFPDFSRLSWLMVQTSIQFLSKILWIIQCRGIVYAIEYPYRHNISKWICQMTHWPNTRLYFPKLIQLSQ